MRRLSDGQFKGIHPYSRLQNNPKNRLSRLAGRKRTLSTYQAQIHMPDDRGR